MAKKEKVKGGPVSVTYVAPEGDSEVITTRGVKFFNGQPQVLDSEEHAGLIAKAKGNPRFEVSDCESSQSEGQ